MSNNEKIPFHIYTKALNSYCIQKLKVYGGMQNKSETIVQNNTVTSRHHSAIW